MQRVPLILLGLAMLFGFVPSGADGSTASFPFFDGFESGTKQSCWSTNWPAGYVSGCFHSGTNGLARNGTFRDTLTINLAGETDVWLSFWIRNYRDRYDTVMPDSYTGTVDADGVSLSVDGGSTWYKVQGLTRTEGLPNDDIYHSFNVNLSAVCASHGLSFVTNTQIRFVHYEAEYAHHCLDDVAIMHQNLNLEYDALSTVEGNSLTVTVVRTGSSSGSVTVDYTTADGTALAGQDYTAQSGTLTFADGVRTQNIIIPIIDDDDYYETNETFTVSISNAVGIAPLGATTNATVTIIRDARAPFPFFEGFEDINPNTYRDIPGFYWHAESGYDGYFVRMGDTLSPRTGNRCLRLMSGDVNPQNRECATLTINLLGQSDVMLKFWHKTTDTYDAVMPTSFSGTNFSDGVAISTDGIHWYKAVGLTRSEGAATNYLPYEVDIDALASANGLTYNKNFKISFQAYDYRGSNTWFDDVAVYADHGLPQIVTTNLPNAISMTAYSTSLAGANGLPPYTWSTTSNLPTGLSLSTNGLLSGIPSDEGTFNLNIRLTDTLLNSTNRMLRLTVTPNANRPPVITATNPVVLNLNMAENTNRLFAITATDPEGSNLIYRWQWDSTPVGTNANSFMLSTAWGDAGNHTLRVTVMDGLWSNVWVEWSIAVTNDNDGDGMPNKWERAYQLNPWAAADAADDPDGDSLSNLEEYRVGTNPRKSDSDGDSLPDGWEVTHNLNPLESTNGIPDTTLSLLGSRDLGGYAYDIAVSNGYAYLAMTEGLVCADISNPSSITGPWTIALPGTAEAVAISDSRAYVACGTGGLQVVNIADPTHPTVTGAYDTDGYSSDIIVRDTHAYVADGTAGLKLINISNPAAPTLSDQLDNINSSFLAKDSTHVYSGGGSVVCVVELETGEKLRTLGSTTCSGSSMTVDENTGVGYCPAAYSGMQMIDLRVSTNPVVVGTEAMDNYPLSACTAKSVLFIGLTDPHTFSSGWILSRDLTDPVHPVTMATNTLPHQPEGMVVVSNRLYVCTSWGELMIYAVNMTDSDRDGMPDSWEIANFGNLSAAKDDDPDGDGVSNLGEYRAGLDPLNSDSDGDTLQDGDEIRIGGDPGMTVSPNSIQYLATLDTPGSARAVAVAANGTACVADCTNGLVLIDISNPDTPALVGHYAGLDEAVDVKTQDNLAYFADSTGGLFKIDVSVPSNPVGLTRYYSGSDWGAIAVQSNLCAYLPQNSYSIQLGLLDIWVDAQQTNAWRGTLGLSSTAADVALSGDYAYAIRKAGSTAVVSVVDISDPNTPTLIRDTDLQSSQSPTAIRLSGNRGYITLEKGGIRVLDLSTPSSPTLIGSYAGLPDAFARDICITDDVAFVVYESNSWDTCQSYGLEIVNVKDAANPVQILQTNAFARGYGVAATSNLVLVAAGDDGLMLFRYSAQDRDLDSLADDWEIQNFGNLSQTGSADPDGDGINNLGEYEYNLTPTNSDQDADGMADGWEIRHGYAVGVADGNLDSDSDGISNAGEFIADTDPHNATDCFTILSCSNGTPVSLRFSSSTGRLYRLEYSTNLMQSGWQIVPGTAPRRGRGGYDELRDTNQIPPRVYYRLKVTLP